MGSVFNWVHVVLSTFQRVSTSVSPDKRVDRAAMDYLEPLAGYQLWFCTSRDHH